MKGGVLMAKINWKGIWGWSIAIILFLGVITYNAYQEKLKSESGVFIIKAVIPLSGSLSIYAGDLKKGLTLAQDEIDSKYGQGKVKIELAKIGGITPEILIFTGI